MSSLTPIGDVWSGKAWADQHPVLDWAVSAVPGVVGFGAGMTTAEMALAATEVGFVSVGVGVSLVFGGGVLAILAVAAFYQYRENQLAARADLAKLTQYRATLALQEQTEYMEYYHEPVDPIFAQMFAAADLVDTVPDTGALSGLVSTQSKSEAGGRAGFAINMVGGPQPIGLAPFDAPVANVGANSTFGPNSTFSGGKMDLSTPTPTPTPTPTEEVEQGNDD